LSRVRQKADTRVLLENAAVTEVNNVVYKDLLL
jgi:hypothetical protein